MHYDVVIIGAGMSGLAAGIRLAYFDKSVCIVEKHYAYGGLNSYYTLDGREFDVGLHAVTNYVPRGQRGAPLTKLLRQLRIEWDELQLFPQSFSEVSFPGRTLRFDNDIQMLTAEVAREFPDQVDRFARFVAEVRAFDDLRMDAVYQSARARLVEAFSDPVLIEMLLCPIMFYGSATEKDMDFSAFVTLFKSIFLEGFARPRGGIRTILTLLVKKFRALGGKLRMQCGVEQLTTLNRHVDAIRLVDGSTLTADAVLSCAGIHETLRLCGADEPARSEVGQISFVESLAVLDRPAASLGHDATIVFFNDTDTFNYSTPTKLVDLQSGIVCCPGNYESEENMQEGLVRMTWLANFERWTALDTDPYQREKDHLYEHFLDQAARWVPVIRKHLVARDLFTPRTIRNYTGHINGAVYGAPCKVRDGRTPFRNLFICGTDQGFLGIIGAMLSGITMANLHVLSQD